MLILLTVPLSVGYICLYASWIVCVGRQAVLFLSLYLFYSTDFIELWLRTKWWFGILHRHGSNDDSPRSWSILVSVSGLWIVPPASKGLQFHRSCPRSAVSICFQPPFPSEKVPPQCFISRVSLPPVIYHAWSNLVPVTPRDSLVQRLDLELSQLWFQPCSPSQH